MPKDPAGFDISVWEIVKSIPEGKVVTYGQVAGLVGLPPGEDAETYKAFGARWVGGSMARCPDGIPWHRVVNSQGKISPRAESGVQRQRERLEAEGVRFDDRERINLKTYQWLGEEEKSPFE
jgi:methylated-DNA-protein-cysteine methyltransferase-like protein